MGDDGFGPAVIESLNQNWTLPADVAAVDVGTGIREYLFDYLLTSDGRPERIVILDAVDTHDKNPGEVFPIQPGLIPHKKIHDFSLHQFPTVNLLSELKEHTDITIDILAAQVDYLPDKIDPGLSPVMQKAVNVACSKLLLMLNSKSD